MMRSPAQVIALLGALPRPCGGALAAVRERYVAWLAFRQPELERSHPAWARIDAADRDEIARESDRLERARRVPDPTPVGAPRAAAVPAATTTTATTAPLLTGRSGSKAHVQSVV